MQSSLQRPMGITVLAILAVVGGAFSLLGGVCAFSGGLLGGAALAGSGLFGAGLAVGAGGIFGGLLALVYGALALAFAYGAWFLKPWAWMLGIVAAGVGLATALFSLLNGDSFFSFLLNAAIDGAILYYLFTPEVKRAFGRA